MFSKALSFFLLLGATRVAKGDDYSYDPNAPNGPANWGNPNDPKNQCNGPKQSPIAFTTNGAISMDGDYVFTVRLKLNEYKVVFPRHIIQSIC